MKLLEINPDIPDKLQSLHREGDLVFFCGAGVSRYKAGLSSFKQLVEQVYSKLGADKKSSEEVAFDEGQYDRVLNLLEKRIDETRSLSVRRLVREILSIDRTLLRGFWCNYLNKSRIQRFLLSK